MKTLKHILEAFGNGFNLSRIWNQIQKPKGIIGRDFDGISYVVGKSFADTEEGEVQKRIIFTIVDEKLTYTIYEDTKKVGREENLTFEDGVDGFVNFINNKIVEVFGGM